MNHDHSASWNATAGAAPSQYDTSHHSRHHNQSVHNNEIAEVPPHPSAAAAAVVQNMFHLGPRFSNFKVVGKGAFGEVCSALDSHQGKRVAIKKVFPMSRDVVSAKHALREIRLMRYLEPHPNIISLEDLLVNQQHDELYIVMELLDCDLHYVINRSNQPLDDVHHRYFMFQILKGVKFLHENRVIHRDLKPSNILATRKCQLRITDFGLARLRPTGVGPDPDDEVDNPMTETAVTRWYRPPELMLCPDGLYGYAVDLWSVGCIFAELLGRQPFFPGQNFKKQLSLIFDAVGSPQPHEVAHIKNPEALRFLDSMQGRVKVPYSELLPDASEASIALLEGLLVFDPPCRLSAEEALNHRYFQPLSGKVQVAPDPEVAPGFDFDFESEPMHLDQLRHMIFQEVAAFHGQGGQDDDDEEENDDEQIGGGEEHKSNTPTAAAPSYHYPAPSTALTPPHPSYSHHQPHPHPHYDHHHHQGQHHHAHHPHHMMSNNSGMGYGSSNYVHDTDPRQPDPSHNYGGRTSSYHDSDGTMETSDAGASAAEAPRYGHVLR